MSPPVGYMHPQDTFCPSHVESTLELEKLNEHIKFREGEKAKFFIL